MKITIIGTGNVAHLLCRLAPQAGHQVVQVVGRDQAKADRLAEACSATAGTDPSVLEEAEIYIIAVTDAAIPEVAGRMHPYSGIVVHTGGSVALSAVSTCGLPCGVLWPLQSIRANLDRIPEIPWVVDGSDEDTRDRLGVFAGTLSGKVGFADDAQRRDLHLAAVHTSNFINQLLVQAEAYCRGKGVDFSLLRPLITETVTRISEVPAIMLRTGPSARGDMDTIGLHRRMLQDRPDMLEVYDVMTRSILHHPG